MFICIFFLDYKNYQMIQIRNKISEKGTKKSQFDKLCREQNITIYR